MGKLKVESHGDFSLICLLGRGQSIQLASMDFCLGTNTLQGYGLQSSFYQPQNMLEWLCSVELRAPLWSFPPPTPRLLPQASAARSYTSLHLLLSIKPQQLGTEGLRLCALCVLIRGHCEWCYFPGCLCCDSIKPPLYRHQALP